MIENNQGGCMIPKDRRDEILYLLALKKFATVEDLAQSVYVSIPTIRRDLQVMEEDGQIRRTHGGALYVSPESGIPPLALRNQTNMNEKIRIGKAASQLVVDGQSLFIDSSSTSLCFVKNLPKNMKCTVCTNGLAIAQAFDAHPNITMELVGGSYDLHHHCTVGAEACDFVEQRWTDWFFVSANTADIKQGIASFSSIDLSLKKKMQEHAKKTVLLLDSSKFHQQSYYTIFNWNQIDILVTDQVDDKIQKICKENKTKIILAK